MVKIHNVFGDQWIGTYAGKIYQRVHGQQVRREGFTRPDPQGPIQEQQKTRFKEFVEWWRSQTTNQKNTLKDKFKEKEIEKKNPQYLTIYHYLLGLGLTPPTIEIVDPDKLTYKVTHPSIQKIEEIDFDGNIVATYDNLSHVYELDFTESQQITPNKNTKIVRVYTPFNQSTDFIIRMIKPVTDIPYELIADLTFTTPTTSFTVSNVQNYKQIYILFNIILSTAAGDDNGVLAYPNGDTGANYVSKDLWITTSGGVGSGNWGGTGMKLCRTVWARQSVCRGTTHIYTGVTGHWRSSYSDSIDISTDASYREFHKLFGYWKNTTNTINYLLFQTYYTNYGLTGRLCIYGLGEVI